MSKRKILIGGRPLHECSIFEIVEHAVDPRRRIYDLGDCADVIRNNHVLAAFGGDEVATTEELVDRFRADAVRMREDFSNGFDALRVGEALQWGIQHRIVERIGARPGPRWRLLERERQFELIGPENRQHAIRVRGLAGPEAVVAARLWDKELKRRERARVKAVERHKPAILRHLAMICRHLPDHALDGVLERFAIGEHRTIIAVRGVIEGELDGMDKWLIEAIERRLAPIAIAAEIESYKQPKAPRASSADEAVLSTLYL